jgi:hypothetical protein
MAGPCGGYERGMQNYRRQNGGLRLFVAFNRRSSAQQAPEWWAPLETLEVQ